jgi:RNA binding exosome subunit/energy-coupling factor transporter ATP-binding protein EcfA2
VRIRINPELLTETHYDSENKALFKNFSVNIDNIVKDILNSNPACYFVSGYRGAGKTSFVKYLEGCISVEEAGQSSPKKLKSETVFVHLNFSSYGTKSTVLRKLFRGVYSAISKANNYKQHQSEKAIKELQSYYDRTFNDVSHSEKQIDQSSQVLETSFVVWKMVQASLIFLAGIAVIFNLNSISEYFRWLSGTVIVGLGINEAVKITKTTKRSNENSKELSRKTLFDDEIAEVRFHEILKGLKALHYRVVIVLDELDKMEEEETNQLFKEIKPFLVCGDAIFIAVGGQNLYYQYVESRSKDDAILSSIFSKFIHIPLMKPTQFHELMRELTFEHDKLTNKELAALRHYTKYLIIESKQVARKFISLIRQETIWDDEDCYLQLPDEKLKFEDYSKILDTLESVINEEILIRNFEPAVEDYYTMQLYLSVHKILSRKNHGFLVKELIEQNGN